MVSVSSEKKSDVPAWLACGDGWRLAVNPAWDFPAVRELLTAPEPADAVFRYSPAEIATHLLPWLNAKIKKPGEGFLARKKARQGK